MWEWASGRCVDGDPADRDPVPHLHPAATHHAAVDPEHVLALARDGDEDLGVPVEGVGVVGGDGTPLGAHEDSNDGLVAQGDAVPGQSASTKGRPSSVSTITLARERRRSTSSSIQSAICCTDASVITCTGAASWMPIADCTSRTSRSRNSPISVASEGSSHRTVCPSGICTATSSPRSPLMNVAPYPNSMGTRRAVSGCQSLMSSTAQRRSPRNPKGLRKARRSRCPRNDLTG